MLSPMLIGISLRLIQSSGCSSSKRRGEGSRKETRFASCDSPKFVAWHSSGTCLAVDTIWTEAERAENEVGVIYSLSTSRTVVGK
jgi:hypothetical protein